MRGGALMAIAVALAGCGDGIVVKNGRPRITWVALEALDGERAALTLWVQDPEGDAVDVAISWSAGAESGPLELVPGSAPLAGLPTELGLNEDEGQPHRVIWDLAGVPEGAVVLTITADDRPHEGDAGDAFRFDGLDPRAGGGPVSASP